MQLQKKNKSRSVRSKTKKQRGGVATQEQKDNYLLEAIVTSEINKVERVLAAGANPNVKDEQGNPALIVAVAWSSGDTEIIKLLLEKGADVNAKESRFGATALAFATSEGHPEIVRLLLEKGADINAKDLDGYTALIDAASNNDIEVIRLLLEKGADINAKDLKGMTALMMASIKNNIEIVNLLLEKGANVNSKDNYGYTALMMASSTNRIEIVSLLLEYGADVNIKALNEEQAIDMANKREYTEIVEMLSRPAPKCMTQKEYNTCEKKEGDDKPTDPISLELIERKDAVKFENQTTACYNRKNLKKWLKLHKTNPLTREPVSDDWIRSNLGHLPCEETRDVKLNTTTKFAVFDHMASAGAGGKARIKPIKHRKTKTNMTRSNKKSKKNTRKHKRK